MFVTFKPFASTGGFDATPKPVAHLGLGQVLGFPGKLWHSEIKSLNRVKGKKSSKNLLLFTNTMQTHVQLNLNLSIKDSNVLLL